MYKESKAMKEIHRIQEKLSKHIKITDKNFVEKTRRAIKAERRRV
jgi:hypothetical protein